MPPDDDINPQCLVPGTQINAYEVISKLGQGGMGDVYKVRRGSKLYALKIASKRHKDLTPEKEAELESRARREVSTLTALKHPNVVHCYGFDKWPDMDTGYLYFVTDLIEGAPIYAWQSQKKPSLRTLLNVFVQIADGLEEIHRRGVFHRDLKDENVLIEETGKPIIIDFGVSSAKAAYTLTAVDQLPGTFGHFSPGLCQYILDGGADSNKPYPYGPPDDLHSVGIMLYEMLSGRAPFALRDKKEDIFKIIKLIAEVVPPLPSTLNEKVPRSIDAIIQKLLEKKPADCFATGAHLASALGAALKDADASWDAPFEVPKAGAATIASPIAHPVAHPIAALLFEDKGPALGSAKKTPLERLKVNGAPVEVPTVKPSADVAAPFVPTDVEVEVKKSVGAVKRESASSLRAHLEELGQRVAQKANKRTRIAGAVVISLLILGVLISIGSSTKAPKEENLLAKYEKEKATEEHSAARVNLASAGGAVLPASLMPDQSIVDGTPSRAAGMARDGEATGSQPTTRKGKTDAAAIDAELTEAYGRPTLVPSGTTAGNKHAGLPSWAKFADTSPPNAPPAGPQKLGVPLGAHITLALKSNLDSRTVSKGLVEASVTRAFVKNDSTLIPRGTMFYGRAQSNGARFFVHFEKAILPEGNELTISADALDGEDKKPGLAPSHAQHATKPAPEGVGTAVAKGTASVLIGTVGGSTAGNVAQTAGQTALNHSDETASDSADTIFLESGAALVAVVQERF